MMLSEDAPVPVTALPVREMRDHLRLGTGFAEDGLQDGVIETCLRAAVAAIEARIGKMLISRGFRWSFEDWRNPAAQALPVAPVRAVASVTLVDGAGVGALVDPGVYRLVADTHRPKLAARGGALPVVPGGGRIEVAFTAGFGPVWADVPPDLRQAVLMLAAEFYEHRSEMGLRERGLPFGIMALIERWRTVRVLGGGAA